MKTFLLLSAALVLNLGAGGFAAEPRRELRPQDNVVPRWPIATPFDELASRIVGGKATAEDKAEFRKLATALKDSGRGPWWDRVRVAESKDGLNFTDLNVTVLEKASVPDAVVDAQGNVWLFFVDGDLDKWVERVESAGPFKTGLMSMGAAKSADGLHFERVEMEIKNVNAGKNVDPDVVVAADGTFHLYYLGVPANELAADTADPARAPGQHKFFLATSRDLIHWTQQGVAWTGPHGGADPAVYRDAKHWFILGGGAGRSEDGGKTFQQIPMTTGRWGQPDVIAVEGGFRIFYSTLNGILSAFSKDGVRWTDEEGVRARGGADPSVVRMKDGSWRLYYKVGGRQPNASQFAGSSAGGPPALQRGEAGGGNQRRTQVRREENFAGTMPPGDGGPRNHRILLASSQDGLKWTIASESLAEQASVPELFSGPDGKLIALFVDASGQASRGALGALVRGDDGKWMRAETNLRGADPNVVRLKDGSYRGYTKDRDGAIIVFSSRDGFGQNPPPAPNDFEPPVGRDENSPRESPGHFRLLSARSSDGLKFVPTGQVISDQANVPDLIAGPAGAIYLYYSGGQVGNRENTLALAVSTDQGKSWNFKHVEIDGAGLEHAGDPDIVRLDDGTFRIFLTTTVNGHHGIVYCDSADGIHFTKRGTAFAKAGLELLDSTTFRLGSTWHTLTLEGTGTLQRHGTSSDGREFSVGEKMPFVVDGEPYIGANGVAADGGYRMYGFSLPARNFRSFITKDGQSWTAENGVRLALEAQSSLGGAQIKDPSVLRLADGSYLMVYVARIPETRRENLSETVRPRSAVGPPALQPRQEQSGQRGPGGQIRVEKIDSKYKAAPGAKPGSFVTGQDADLMLGGFGFNNTGGALHFNHPTGLATDGKALLMTDRWNNRVLIWKSAPAKNTPPDLVLGQPDFTQNNPGTGKHQMNWPGNVAITPDGQRIAVTDTDNDRILIWNSFPTMNGAEADVVLELAQLSGGGTPTSGTARGDDNAGRQTPPRREPGNFQRAEPEAGAPRRPQVGRGIQRFAWPWGVWTDGRKFAVVATHGHVVLIWNSLPLRDNQPPDLVLNPNDAGTPRNVTSDGNWFAVSDHNNGEASRPATMVWRTFPTSATQPPDFKWSEWLKGSFTTDGKLVVGGMSRIYIWNKTPQDAKTDADVILRPPAYRNGDGPDAVVANGRFYACSYNGNNLLGWNSLPTRDNQPPDFSIGSDTPEQDTWAENFFVQNAVVATDGRSLFVSSDFNRKMFVWRKLPDESAAKPDLVFHLPEGPWDSELHGSTLVLAGRNTVYIWRKLPLNGEQPDVTLSGSIGSARLGEITGVAFDEKYFYLSDRSAEAIYVWEGIPARDSEPKFTLAMRSPGRLNSDGNYLAAAPFEGGGISLWRVSGLSSRAEPVTLGGRGQFNLPSECLIADGRLFVANRSFNRVDVWNRVEDALAGRPADALLGATDEQDRKPEIGRNQLFGPGSLAWGGGYLWVGEFKFSTRILRFSPRTTGALPPRAQQPTASPAAFVQAAAGNYPSASAALEPSERARKAAGEAPTPPGTVTDWGAHWSQGRAVGKGPVRFTHSPMQIEDIKSVVPYGLMVGGHVCPIDHGYFYPKQLQPGQPHFDVMAPADGFIVAVGHRTQLTGSSERGREYDDYALTMEHSGTFYTQYDLLTSLDKSVLDQLAESVRGRFARKQMGPPVQTRIAVKAGQVVGKVGGRSLDFGVVNTEVRLPGFLTPKLYGHYAWRVHIVDPFDFFDEPLKSKLLALNVRKVKPFFGRIDYDVDGRLVGNWFLEGSGGYPGDRRDPRGYWMGHLAFAPHHIDPTKIVVSIGDFDSKPRQLWVKGNAPDPAKVGEKDGVVKYELIWGQLGSAGDRQVRNDADVVQGTVLAQVLPGRRLKFEAFPGQTAAQVTDFTAAARFYER